MWRGHFCARSKFQNNSSNCSAQSAQRCQNFFHVGQLADGVDLGEGNRSIFVDDEGSALCDARHRRAFPQNAELTGYLGMRIEVGAQRNLYRSDVFLPPRDVAGDGVYADVQNLGIERLELFAAGIEFGHLAGSSRGPVERVEGDDHMLLAKIVARANDNFLLARDGGEFELGRGVANFQGHSFLQSERIVNEIEPNRINQPLTFPLSSPFNISPMPEQPLSIEDLPGAQTGTRILRLSGPLTLYNVFGFQAKVRADESRALILDFTNVPLMDSAGIGALVGAYVSRQRAGRSLALVGVNQRIYQALEVTRVESFFQFYGTVAEAEQAA
jgi:anti-sigma B factor antagonist